MISSLLLAFLLLAQAVQIPPAQEPLKVNRAPVSAPEPPGTRPAPSPAVDRAFALAATESTHAELVLAQLALGRSRTDEVRAYARQMISEHTGLTQQLAPELRRVYRATVPSDLTAADMLTYYRLAHAASPVEFDEAYALAQVDGHLAALGAFETQGTYGADPTLKAVVRRWTPTIEAHLELAIDLVQHVGGSSPLKGAQ